MWSVLVLGRHQADRCVCVCVGVCVRVRVCAYVCVCVLLRSDGCADGGNGCAGQTYTRKPILLPLLPLLTLLILLCKSIGGHEGGLRLASALHGC